MFTKSKDTAGYELDLLANYPKANRNLKERLENKTESDREMNNVETEGQSKKVVARHIDAESYR